MCNYFLKDDSLEDYLEFYKDISDEYKEFKDNEYRNELTFSLVVKDAMKLSEEEVIKRQITIKEFKPKNYKTIYKYINSMID